MNLEDCAGTSHGDWKYRGAHTLCATRSGTCPPPHADPPVTAGGAARPQCWYISGMRNSGGAHRGRELIKTW